MFRSFSNFFVVTQSFLFDICTRLFFSTILFNINFQYFCNLSGGVFNLKFYTNFSGLISYDIFSDVFSSHYLKMSEQLKSLEKILKFINHIQSRSGKKPIRVPSAKPSTGGVNFTRLSEKQRKLACFCRGDIFLWRSAIHFFFACFLSALSKLP